MNFAFYDQVGSRSLFGFLPTSARRIARRIMRPVFFRLRDLLTELHSREQEDRARIQALTNEVERLRSLIQAEIKADRSLFLAELSAFDGRMAAVEDFFLEEVATPKSAAALRRAA